jgi:hypothetical protein
MKNGLRKLVPARFKTAAKSALQRRRMFHGLRALKRLRKGEMPSRDTLQQLSLGWGNEGFAANIDYLEEVARKATTVDGAILECGSGLTTLLLGTLAGKRGVAVHSLEHSDEWQRRIAAVLSKHGIGNVSVLSAPLRDYGGFAWYDAPLQQLPKTFRMVVCDGPPGMTKGGRYGLMPVIGERLASGAVIVLDDAGRPGEREMMERWQKEVSLHVEVFDKPAGKYATLVKR